MPIVRIVAPVVSCPINANRVEVPPNGCLNNRRPAPGAALVSAAGPVIVNTMAESSPELGDVSRTFSSPGPETLVESPPQLNPTAITPASNAAPKSRFIAGLLSAAAPALQAR